MRKYLVAAVATVALFLDLIDTTAVSVALPTIGREFGVADASALQAVITAYLVALAVSLPASGWLGNRFGAGPVFTAALVLFLLGSTGCALAPSPTALIVARSMQGLGGGLLVPLALATVLNAFPEAERARASAIVSVPAAIAPALGPVLGGWIATSGDWRWIFAINLPLGVASLVVGLRVLPRERVEQGGFDLSGFLLVGAATVALVVGLGLIDSSLALGGSIILAGLALGATALLVERCRPEPLIPLRLFRRRAFAVGNTVMLLASVSFAAMVFAVPLSRQDLRGESALVSGLVLAPHAIGILVATPLAARAVRRSGARPVLLIGMLVTAVTTAGLGATVAWGPWITGALLLVGGLGFGLCVVPLQTAPFAGMPSSDIALGTPALSLARQIGSAFGPAVAALVISALVSSSSARWAYGSAFAAAALAAAGGVVVALLLDPRPATVITDG